MFLCCGHYVAFYKLSAGLFPAFFHWRLSCWHSSEGQRPDSWSAQLIVDLTVSLPDWWIPSAPQQLLLMVFCRKMFLSWDWRPYFGYLQVPQSFNLHLVECKVLVRYLKIEIQVLWPNPPQIFFKTFLHLSYSIYLTNVLLTNLGGLSRSCFILSSNYNHQTCYLWR